MIRTVKFLLPLLLAGSGVAWAEEDATLALGRRLLAEHQCNGACHASQSKTGDALGLYSRADRRVHDLGGLKAQARRCVAGAGATLTPAEFDALVAALNQDYYKFK